MLKFVLGASLLACSCAALANDWALMSDTAERKIYFDPASVKRTGSSVRISVMFDYAAPQAPPVPVFSKAYLSTIEHLRFYCPENAFMSIASATYIKPKGDGESNFNLPWPSWLLSFEPDYKLIAEKFCMNLSAIPLETREDIVYVDADEYLKQYLADQATTTEVYKNVQLRVYGRLDQFAKGDMDNDSLILNAPHRDHTPEGEAAKTESNVTARMFLSSGQAQGAAEIEAGHIVIMSCKQYEYGNGQLVGHDCTIAEHS